MSLHDVSNDDKCSDIKATLAFTEPIELLLNLLKMQSAPDVDMECFGGNVLEYCYFMALFSEVAESKIENQRGRPARLMKYAVGDARDLIKHYIQLPSNEQFAQAKYLLENM